jgi:hypothetical protein
MNENTPTERDPDRDFPMEDYLQRYGELWMENVDSARRDPALSFRKELARAAKAEQRARLVPNLHWHPGWVWASAALLLALIVGIGLSDRNAGGIVYMAGNVQIQSEGADSKTLRPGARIQVQEGGQAMLSLDGERIDLFLKEGTDLTVNSKEQVRLEKGDLWVRVDPNSGHFGIETPQGTIQVVGTTFGVSVNESGTTVEIAEGKLEVSTRMGREFITPGKGALLTAQDQVPATHASSEDVSPAWAEEVFQKAAQSRARSFFPSANP